MSNFKSANSQLVKSLNQQLVLNLIRQRGPVSGAELAKITRLQPATISKILKTLCDLRMIREAGIGQSTSLGGKRPNLWRLNENYGYVIGIEVLKYELRGVLLSFHSSVLAEKSQPLQERINSENIPSSIHDIVRALCKSARIAMKNLIGIGLGISGMVDPNSGAIRYSIAFDLKDYPIAAILEERLGVPVLVDNDANAAAVGAKWMGCGQNAKHIVYMTVNESVTGIGCGIILNGQIFHGATYSAGELPLELPALRELHIENLSGSANRGEQIYNQTSVTMPKLIQDARDGALGARKTLVKLGKTLAREVARILDFINPELIIFGGDIVEAEDLILQPVRDEVKRLALELPFDAVQIRMTGFGKNAVAIGAASMVFKEIFKETQAAVKHVFEVPGRNLTARGNKTGVR